MYVWPCRGRVLVWCSINALHTQLISVRLFLLHFWAWTLIIPPQKMLHELTEFVWICKGLTTIWGIEFKRACVCACASVSFSFLSRQANIEYGRFAVHSFFEPCYKTNDASRRNVPLSIHDVINLLKQALRCTCISILIGWTSRKELAQEKESRTHCIFWAVISFFM